LNPLDYVLIGVLLFFFVAGYMKGFLAQFLQILGIIASFFLASRFYLAVAENSLFEGMRQRSASAAQVTAWIVIFFVSGAIFSVLSSIAAKRFQNEHLKPGDRWLGALFSTVKGVIILGGIALGLQEWKFPSGTALPPAEQQAAEGLVTSSLLIPRLGEACFAVVSAIPTQQRDELRKMIEQHRFHLDPGNGDDGDPRLVTPLVPDGEEIEEAVVEKAPTRKPVLLPLGELRKLRMKEDDGTPKIAPTSAREE
jgi:uncharacterized membrane protein required for colicin V production